MRTILIRGRRDVRAAPRSSLATLPGSAAPRSRSRRGRQTPFKRCSPSYTLDPDAPPLPYLPTAVSSPARLANDPPGSLALVPSTPPPVYEPLPSARTSPDRRHHDASALQRVRERAVRPRRVLEDAREPAPDLVADAERAQAHGAVSAERYDATSSGTKQSVSSERCSI